MFKEMGDLQDACKNVIERSDNIKNLALELTDLIDKTKSKATQENAVEMTLAIRKELATMFILNSNIEDNFKTLQKILNSLKKLKISK